MRFGAMCKQSRCPSFDYVYVVKTLFILRKYNNYQQTLVTVSRIFYQLKLKELIQQIII